VDKLRKTISEQSISVESLGVAQEQSTIAASLTTLLNHLFVRRSSLIQMENCTADFFLFCFVMLNFIQGEISRKDEELEARRQELHRLREQNHGYHERLQKSSSRPKKSTGTGDDASVVSRSPTLVSPQPTRPTSFASHSSPSSDHHDDEGKNC